jgi:hypothetical protein
MSFASTFGGLPFFGFSDSAGGDIVSVIANS